MHGPRSQSYFARHNCVDVIIDYPLNLVYKTNREGASACPAYFIRDYLQCASIRHRQGGDVREHDCTAFGYPPDVEPL